MELIIRVLHLLGPDLVLKAMIIFLIGLFLFTLYMVLGGSGKLMNKLREEDSQTHIQKTVPTLLPWEASQALADISSLCLGRKISSGLGGGRSHCRGTVRSLKNWRQAWLAYAINSQRRIGTIILHTSYNKLMIEVRGDARKRGWREGFIKIDGKPFGSIRLEARELFDAQGRQIGEISRGRTLIIPGMTDYRTLKLDGRIIAEINDEPLAPLERLGPSPPAFRIRQEKLSADEEWWMLAVLAIALYSECLASDV